MSPILSRFISIRVGLLLFPILFLTTGCGTESDMVGIQAEEPGGQSTGLPTTIQPEIELTDQETPELSPEIETSGLATPISEKSLDEKGSSKGSAAEANADVEFVRAVQMPGGSWTFHVTVRHPDTGWEDYADGWDVITPEGHVLKRDSADPFTRLLLHPHEEEQPFTRSQSGLVIPDGIERVTVQAHDLVAGFGGRSIEVDLTVSNGPGFEVERQ